MTSTLISPCLGFRENFQQREVLNQTLSSASLDLQLELLSQVHETSVAEKLIMPPSSLLTSASTITRPPITRRHSSSTFSSAIKPSTQLPAFSENNPYLNSMVGSSLEVLPEEHFRNRAYSEGSSALNIESAQEQVAQQQTATSRYKTELCRQFEESGKCKYGDKCQFAHGKAELRHMVRHPKYKTELCRTYHSSGICPYGPRCHFIHNPDEPNVIMQKQVSVPASSLGRASGDRPMKLQLGFQLNNSYPYSPPLKSPLETAAFLFGASEALVSPRSPIDKVGNNQLFNFSRVPLSPSVLASPMAIENRRNSPPSSKFEFPPSHFSDLSKHEDRVFSGTLTPPDSDRESSTGSPPGFGAVAPSQQRLPIFRCLSQSEQKGV